ncbi:MAG: helix-turn-helix transcriptional regulator [DPANN group archaeon]|nr:helix-turn-helix transcriptional regulator [DPANN group archaeon]
MRTIHKFLPNCLRKYRRAAGFKQKDVACILGLKSASMISRWENGLCLPKLQSLFKLAILYRTMVDALFIDLRILLREEITQAERIYRRKRSGNQACQ